MILILLVFAFVIFAIAGFWNPAPPSPWFGRLIAAGLAFWVFAEILIHAPAGWLGR
jgi:cell division protein FtsW (lipid II flippase)